jgi:hypothetical protein
MAKLRDIFSEVTAGNVCVYRMRGKVYLRSKSSLTRKRVLKSKAFEKTRKYAGDLGKASRLASAIYREFPSAKRDRSKYQAITGMAASLLYQGLGEEEVQEMLKKKKW